MAGHNELGEWGENIAREYLMGQGYTVLDKNTHIGHKEIDIIAIKGVRMVFVEVKTRTSGIEEALDAVDNKKIRRMVKAADSFMQRYTAPYEYQFDIIAIAVKPDGTYIIEHFPDAFFPPLNGY